MELGRKLLGRGLSEGGDLGRRKGYLSTLAWKGLWKNWSAGMEDGGMNGSGTWTNCPGIEDSMPSLLVYIF